MTNNFNDDKIIIIETKSNILQGLIPSHTLKMRSYSIFKLPLRLNFFETSFDPHHLFEYLCDVFIFLLDLLGQKIPLYFDITR